MIRILFFILLILQAIPAQGAGSLAMPDAPALESSPKSKEIKKIAKLIEDPAERAKLLKTLKVMASVKEAEEKKKAGSIVDFIMPVLQFGVDGITVLLKELRKVPAVIVEFVDYLQSEENRSYLWTALFLWLPILIFAETLIERVHLWLWKRTPKRKGQQVAKPAYRKTFFATIKLFLPFLYPLMFLRFYVHNTTIQKWVVGFWFVLFLCRLLLLARRNLPLLEVQAPQRVSSKPVYVRYIAFFSSASLLAIGGVINLWDILNGRDTFLIPFFLFSFPLFILYFREWRVTRMPQHLEASKNLITAPHKLSSLINILIRYLPWVILSISIPVGLGKVVLGGDIWETYGYEDLETLILFAVFLMGRQRIDALNRFHFPKFKAPKLQAFSAYVVPLQLPFLKCLQWVWHLSFFIILIAIWDSCLSGLIMSTLSHPLMKTLTTIGMIWGIIYVLWLGLDFFVLFHTKPQTIRGKRREPTIFAKTFGPMLHSVARWIMVLVAFFITLETFGFDLKVLAFLMGALAFAISLGSQSLVKDIINGFFALVDGSFAVGDVVTVGAHTGAVESLSLRAITLRHKDGSLQKIPFSEVGNIINRSRDYTIVPIDVATSYKTKIGVVYEALSLAAEEMAQDPKFGKMILEPLSVSGVDRFADSSVHVSASIKITPDPYNYFGREMNRRLKIHMDALGITPPISFQEEWGKE